MCLLFLRYYLHNSLLNIFQSTSIDDDPFTNLPQEIIIDIFSRLPLKTLISCKQVCKAWRKRIEGSEFATSCLSKSKASYLLLEYEDMKSSKPKLKICRSIHELLLAKSSTKPFRVCEFADDDDSHGCTTVSHFGLPRRLNDCTELIFKTSTNGLLLFSDEGTSSRNLFICNPITREYTKLPPPSIKYGAIGFGASKVSGQYKVVKLRGNGFGQAPPTCEVYGVGREGEWRSVVVPDDCYGLGGAGVYSNGNLHWMVYDPKFDYFYPMVRCFDLETEVFTTLCIPPYLSKCGGLFDLEGRLCLRDNSVPDRVDMWFMNKYGDEKSWTKEFVIKDPPLNHYGFINPLKLFKDGDDILFQVRRLGGRRLFLYSNKTKAFQEYGLLQAPKRMINNIIVYSPTFLSLETMGIQDTHVQPF